MVHTTVSHSQSTVNRRQPTGGTGHGTSRNIRRPRSLGTHRVQNALQGADDPRVRTARRSIRSGKNTTPVASAQYVPSGPIPGAAGSPGCGHRGDLHGRRRHDRCDQTAHCQADRRTHRRGFGRRRTGHGNARVGPLPHRASRQLPASPAHRCRDRVPLRVRGSDLVHAHPVLQQSAPPWCTPLALCPHLHRLRAFLSFIPCHERIVFHRLLHIRKIFWRIYAISVCRRARHHAYTIAMFKHAHHIY